MLSIILIFFLQSVHFSPANPGLKANALDSLKIHVKDIRHTFKSPKDSAILLRFQIQYPIISSGHKALSDSLNNEIHKFVNASIIENSEPEPPDTLFLDFVEQYQSLQKRFPKYHLEWNFNREVNVIFQSKSIVSLRFNEHSFTGGAHPISYTYYKTFSRDSGKKLSLNDLFKPDFRNALTMKAERIFRKDKAMSPDSSFAAAGYWFKNNFFSLNNNYALTGKGLQFFYNDYEIAPYYMGSTKMIVPYDELKSVLKPEYFPKETAKK